MIARTSCKKIRRVQLVGKLFGPRYNELNAASMKDLLGLIQAYIVRKYRELNSVAPDIYIFRIYFQVLCIICRRVHLANHAVIGSAHRFYNYIVERLSISAILVSSNLLFVRIIILIVRHLVRDF
jgi:hypothetical protein